MCHFMTDLREILYQKLDVIRRLILCLLHFAASRRSVNNDNNGCVIQWQNSWFLPSPRGFDSFYTYQIFVDSIDKYCYTMFISNGS